MYRQAEQIFYASAIAILMAVFFVINPNGTREVSSAQERIFSDVSLAFTQLIGDEPLFRGVSDLWDGVEGFYVSAADQALVLIQPTEAETRTLAFFYKGTEAALGRLADGRVAGITKETEETESAAGLVIEESAVLSDFGILPIGEPIYNIVPYTEADITRSKLVGQAEFEPDRTVPVRHYSGWMTVEDAITRQKYCLAVYNGEVNKYLGECVYEYN